MADRGALAPIIGWRVEVAAFATRHRTSICLIAFALFGIFFVASASSLDANLEDVSWGWIAAAAALVPFAVLANAFELSVCANATRRTMPLRAAVRYSAVATIANMLPLPAGMIVRAKALSDGGAGWRESGLILVSAAFLWLAMAIACVGIALLPENAGFLLLGAGSFSSLIVLLFITRRSSARTAGGFLAVRGAMLALLVLRLYCCLIAIQQPLPLPDVTVFTLAGVVGNGVAVVPSGIGVAEAVGAGMAGLVGALPAAAFLALAINRLLGLAGSGIAAAYLLSRRREIKNGLLVSAT